MGYGHIGQMDVDDILPAHIFSHLPHCLKEELVFDITHGSADLYDHQISGFLLGNVVDVGFDDIGDMGDVLNGLSQVIPSALLFPDHVEYLAHGQVPGGLAPNTEESLVVSEIHIHLTAIIEHKHLPVFKGVHGAGINIEVAVTFDGDDLESLGEQVPDGGSGDSLSEP